MTTVKVAAAVLNQLPLDWDGNLQRILGAIETAREDGVQVLCLPEMCIPGYGCEDAYFSPSMHDLSWQMLQEISHDTGTTACVCATTPPFRSTVISALG